MNFKGIWVNPKTEDKIRLSCPSNGDDYTIYYNFNGETFLSSEIISIYFSNKQHALLTGSEKFGRCDIIISNENQITMGHTPLEREV